MHAQAIPAATLTVLNPDESIVVKHIEVVLVCPMRNESSEKVGILNL
jgi:hypothetical protein